MKIEKKEKMLLMMMRACVVIATTDFILNFSERLKIGVQNRTLKCTRASSMVIMTMTRNSLNDSENEMTPQQNPIYFTIIIYF
jgi:hypothetical protein